ncbi:MAG: DUF4838 domain-containing protein [Verrucomicrobiae bacterium]|nr:DUF4838 domain-containing protein [Verrucomicrobiae bacterium]
MKTTQTLVRIQGSVFVAASLWAVSALPAADLVREGEARCLIVTADAPSPAAREGSKRLAAELERISGAKVRVATESALGSVEVVEGKLVATVRDFRPDTFLLVGESDLAKRLGVTADGLGPGGIRLRSVGNAMVLLGADEKTPADPSGSRSAVVAFLEEALGVRYLWPGELGLVIPKTRTIALPTLDREFTPPIVQRKIRWSTRRERLDSGIAYLGFSSEEYDAAFAGAVGKTEGLPDWLEWQRLGGSLDLAGGHSYGHTWEKYHRDHPEWFALQPNGSRDLADLTPDRARLCKSNLALIEALAKDKIAELDRTGAGSISLSPNDGGRATFCMCEACKALDPPEGRKITLLDHTVTPPREFEYVSLTDRMVWFWNQLATRVSAERPGTWFVVYAYSAYKAPPVREKLHPNIAVAFVGGRYDSDAARREARDDWDAWSKMTGKLYWRPNLLLYGRRNGVPAVFIHKLTEDLNTFAHHSLLGTDYDSIVHHWATEGLNYYALARLLWNPDLGADAILDDYCERGFGPAAEPVKRWFLRIEALTDQVAAREIESTLEPYTPAVCAELHGLLDRAAEAAGGDDTIGRRIAFLRTGIEFVEIQARTHAFADAHLDRRPTPAEAASFQADMEAKFQLMRRLFRDQPLALNTPMIAWGSEGLFRRLGWNGAKSLPSDRWDADEEGRVPPPPGK